MIYPNSKIFSEKDYKENDYKGKITAADLLESTGRFILEISIDKQKEMYKKGDFLIRYLGDNSIIKVEAERKVIWTVSGRWQGFATLHVPIRKKYSESILYVMVNFNLNTAAVMRTEIIHNSPVCIINTKKDDGILTIDEEFFDVPLDKIQFYHKNQNGWKLITSTGRKIL